MPALHNYDPSLTAAKLAVQALGLTPIGTPWTQDVPLECALDASPITAGRRVGVWRPTGGFLNQLDVTSSPMVSGEAQALTAKAVLDKTRRVVLCREGAFPLATDAARTWFYTDPPEPPFVAVMTASASAHLIWRTPVSWSRDDFIVRHGADLFRIRRPYLLRVADLLNAHEGPVFAKLDREGGHPEEGRLRDDVVGTPLAAELADLTPGELMALGTLCKQHPDEPKKPNPIRLS